MERQRYGQIASILIGACLVHEALRVALDRPWVPFEAWASHTASVSLVLLWGLTIAALLNRKRSQLAASLSWVLSIFSVIAQVMSAAMVLAFTPQPGFAVAYALVAVATGFCVKRAFDRGLLRHGRDLDLTRI